jgi:hypothetical protein
VLIASIEDEHFLSKRAGSAARRLYFDIANRIVRISDISDHGSLRGEFVQQLQSLGDGIRPENGDACGIAARSVQACH